ncbi:hypothetical protein FRB99_002046 [Tulasnella sp. 403]|nr:hypothetical protein FRB99_002046 [Tulasnella sp. 403]
MISPLHEAIDQASKVLHNAIRRTDNEGYLDLDRDLSIGDAELEISTLEVVLGPLYQACSSILARAKQKRNLLAPVNRLSTELLVYVLGMVVDDYAAWNRHRAIRTLGSVCNRWRFVIHGTPAFWKCVYDSHPLGYICDALSKSDPHPLQISIQCDDGRTRHQDFIDGIRKHQPRWNVLSFGFDRSICTNCIQHVLASDHVPLLRTVHLRGPANDSRTAVIPTPLFQGQAINLQALSIEYNIVMPWEPATFPALRSLKLEGIYRHAPTFSQFVALLQSRCLELETLVVRSVDFQGTFHPPQGAVLQFPNLATLSLVVIEGDLVSFVVGSVQFLVCQTLEIRVAMETMERGSSFLSRCLARASPALQSAASKLPDMKAELEVLDRHIEYTANSGEQYRFLIRLSVFEDAAYQSGWTPESLTRVTSAIPPLPLSVTFTCYEDRALPFDPMLCLEGTTTLRLETRADESTPLALQRLGEPIIVDGVNRFPFPHLEVLDLTGGKPVPEDVLMMLANRQSHSAQESQTEYPRKLKKLMVPWYKEFLDETRRIQEILGDGRVTGWW